METVEQVKGWMLSGANPELYKFHTDDKVFHSGKRSGVLTMVRVILFNLII